MSPIIEFRPSGSNSKQLSNGYLIQENSTTSSSANEEDLSPAFRDLQLSVLSKAVNISPSIKNVTLGANSKSKFNVYKTSNESAVENSQKELEFLRAVSYSSTPKKRISYNRKLKKGEDREKNYTFQKLLEENDFERRLNVDRVVQERIQNMYDTSKLIKDSLEHLKQTRQEEIITRRVILENKIINDIQEQEILNKPKREAQWERDNLKEAQRIHERNQKVKEAEEEAKKKSEILYLKRKQIDQILYELQKEYNKEYKNLVETIKACQNKAAIAQLTASHSKTLKDCAAMYEGILKKCKSGDITDDDVQSSKKLVETIKCVHEYFSKKTSIINEELNTINDKTEEIQGVEDTEKVAATEIKESSYPSDCCDVIGINSTPYGEIVNSVKEYLECPSPITSDTSVSISSRYKKAIKKINNNLSDCYDTRSFQHYVTLKTNLENFEKTIKPLLLDESMKKFKFNCQKAVTIPVNAISPVSGSHLADKYLKLHHLLTGKVIEVGDIKISASQHPLGISFCKNLLAKKFVRQGDLTVSSKPDAAFSIAAVLASLWVDFPDFGKLVLAHFHSACPYLAPVFMPQVEGQSDEDYHKSLGYHYTQNGVVEKQDSFLKRMSGIMRLYAALLTSKPRQPGKMNPLGLSEGWRWLSAILNLEPRPDICATLIHDFLEVAGHEMFRAYGGQFKKLLAYLCQEYFPKLEKVTPSTSGGPLVRLEGFLQKVLKEEFIPPPNGTLPPNFW